MIPNPDGKCVTQNKPNEEVPVLLRSHEVEKASVSALVPEYPRSNVETIFIEAGLKFYENYA